MLKFRSNLFKGLRFPKAEPLDASRRTRNLLHNKTQEGVKKQSGGLFSGETLVGGFPFD